MKLIGAAKGWCWSWQRETEEFRMGLMEEELTSTILAGFFAVYNSLGFGLSERVYLLAMEQELLARGLEVSCEVHVPVYHRGVLLQQQRLDMLVNNKVILELKATPALHPSARQQLLNYLRLTPHPVGLLLHFGPRPHFARLVHTTK